MSTLVYAPEVQIIIATSATSRGKGRIIDVSEDISSGSITRLNNGGISSTEFVLLNQSRKYDGMFGPMDRVVVYLRRIKKVLKFSGYLDFAPAWAAEPGSLQLRASCTLKRLANFMWDPASEAAAVLLNQQVPNAIFLEDGGIAQTAVNVLTKVMNWPLGAIHIGRVPHDWYDTVASVADKLIAEAEVLAMTSAVGAGSFVNGQNPATAGKTMVDGIGPGTGTLPASQGRASQFGGPGGGAHNGMALTGEDGDHPKDGWYCAMRWPYADDNGHAVKGVDGAAARKWWANRKILVTNPKTNKAVVVRAADWGPNITTGRVIDLAPTALSALGAVTDDVVNIFFAPPEFKLGPVTGSPGIGSTSGSGAPSAITSGWGTPGDMSNMVQAEAGGIKFTCHRLAKASFEGFVNDLITGLGYHPKVIQGFVNKTIRGGTVVSNHAYGAAIDIDPTINQRYATAAGGPYALPRPPAIVELARKWGLGWGGEYKNSKDYMHFEVIGAPASTAAAYKTNPPKSSATVLVKWQPPIKNPPGWTISARFHQAGGHWSGTHTGTDFAAPKGTPIYPVGPGTVYDHGTGDPSFGNWVTIDHGAKVYTFYAHMDAPSPVPVGTPVNTNTVIGNVGMTGNTTGPHVHTELRKGTASISGAVDIEKFLVGTNRLDPPAGVTLADGQYDSTNATIGASGVDMAKVGEGLFNVWQWEHQYIGSVESGLLGGYRALMNDTPISGTVGELMGAGMRDWCSAPNGDFIAWFPDYFGHYKQAGKMVISTLEIQQEGGPPTVGWNDQYLKTHQFVTGAFFHGAGDADTVERRVTTAGVASVEFPELLQALFKVSHAEAVSMGTDMLQRFGARPEYTPMNQISGPRAEFFMACTLFQQNFGQQYQANINLTFMPELFPGMLACFPEYGIQGYVIQTVDSWDLRGGGFTSTATCAPWSTIGRSKNAVVPLPVGAPL